MKKTFTAIVSAVFLSTAYTQTETSAMSTLKQGAVDTAWARGFTGLRSSIAVIDNGIDTTHKDFTGKIVNSKNFVTNSPVTWGVHGTGMASIDAGALNSIGTVGVAPNAGIMFAQVGSGGTSNAISAPAVNAALLWASSQNATVINMSFGSPKFSATYNAIAKVYFSPSSKEFDKLQAGSTLSYYQTAAARGSILVIAAGNDGQAYPSFPGNYVSRTVNGNLVLGGRAIVVGAVDQNNQIASFSNRAGHVCQNTSGSKCLDIVRTRDYFLVAPGVNVVAAQPNQVTGSRNSAVLVSGTSASAAYTSGGIAVIKQAWPHLKPEQLVNLLLTTAKDLGAPGVDDVYGRGLIDLNRATAPIGTLAVASPTARLGTTSFTGTQLSTSALSGPIAAQLKTSTILKETQVIDQYGRNYTADLTTILGLRSPIYDYASPYMGHFSYIPMQWKYNNLDFIARVGTQGSGLEITKNLYNFGIHYQIGSTIESNGFLGNQGSGAMDMGTSATLWQIFGASVPLTDSITLRSSYGLGYTHITNKNTSMIEFAGPIKSHTAQVGIVKSNFIKENDNIAMGVGLEPRIYSGHARLSAVTGYRYDETINGDISADPVVSKEDIDLKQKPRPVIYLGYQMPVDKLSKVTTSLTTNQFGYRIGVNFTWLQ
jgi:hypothetical protein